MSVSSMDPSPGLRALRRGLCPAHPGMSVPGTRRALVFRDEGREGKDGVEWALGRENGDDTFSAGSSQGVVDTVPQIYRRLLCGEPRTAPGQL